MRFLRHLHVRFFFNFSFCLSVTISLLYFSLFCNLNINLCIHFFRTFVKRISNSKFNKIRSDSFILYENLVCVKILKVLNNFFSSKKYIVCEKLKIYTYITLYVYCTMNAYSILIFNKTNLKNRNEREWIFLTVLQAKLKCRLIWQYINKL